MRSTISSPRWPDSTSTVSDDPGTIHSSSKPTTRQACRVSRESWELQQMTDSGAYLVGREPGNWPVTNELASGLLFAAIHKDGETLEGLEFKHCTFANISFKEGEFKQCRFTNCAFLNCYFRRAQIRETSFVGCKFLSCEFQKVAIRSCDFKYSRFENCVIPFDELEYSLPREPNLRQELAHALSVVSDGLGYRRDGQRYRLASIRAKQAHLWAAIFSKSDWYQSHYRGLRKLEAFAAVCCEQNKRRNMGSWRELEDSGEQPVGACAPRVSYLPMVHERRIDSPI